MILSDCLTVAISVMALVVLYLDKKIPKRYGGHEVGPIKVSEHFARFTKDGKPLPNLSEVRQKRIKSLRRFLLWTMAVVAIVVFILRKLGW
jgi:sugar phosphate permease